MDFGPVGLSEPLDHRESRLNLMHKERVCPWRRVTPWSQTPWAQAQLKNLCLSSLVFKTNKVLLDGRNSGQSQSNTDICSIVLKPA